MVWINPLISLDWLFRLKVLVKSDPLKKRLCLFTLLLIQLTVTDRTCDFSMRSFFSVVSLHGRPVSAYLLSSHAGSLTHFQDTYGRLMDDAQCSECKCTAWLSATSASPSDSGNRLQHLRGSERRRSIDWELMDWWTKWLTWWTVDWMEIQWVAVITVWRWLVRFVKLSSNILFCFSAQFPAKLSL